MVALARTHPSVRYAANVEEAHLLDVLPAITWDPWDATAQWTYQTNIATDHILTIHIHASDALAAEKLADDFWVSLQNAPADGPSLADGTHFQNVRADDVPIEHRTAGQQFNYFNYTFTATVSVGR